MPFYPLIRRAPLLLVAALSLWMSTPCAFGVIEADKGAAGEYLFDKPLGTESLEVDDQRLLLIGNFSVWMGATMGLEFNDNVNLDPENGLSDLIVRPSVFTRVFYPMTETNVFNFIGSIGVSRYLRNPQFNNNLGEITPDTVFTYTIQMRGEIEIEIKDRFSLQQDPTTSPVINRTVNYRRFENGFGITTKWRLSTATVGIGINRDDVISISSEFESLSRTQHRGSLFYTHAFGPGFSLGGTYTISNQRYKEDVQNDSMGHHFTLDSTFEFSKYLNGHLSIGYAIKTFESNGTISDSSDLREITLSSGLEHRLTDYTSHVLAFSIEPQSGFGTNFFNDIKLSYTMKSRLNDAISGSISGTVEQINESGGGSRAQRYFVVFDLNYDFIDRVSISTQYRFLKKNSTNALQSYTENKFKIDISYSF